MTDLPFHLSSRCGAMTRGGTPCRAPAVKGKKRCRMHGGATGSGLPKGNQNALKYGLYTAEMRALRKAASQNIRASRQAMREIEQRMAPKGDSPG